MKYPIKYGKITANTEFYQELVQLHEEAKVYLMDFNWCRKILDSDLYLNFGATLSIFLFEIENTGSEDDNYLWIVAGDSPFMYLDVHGARKTKQVLNNYILLAEDWINQIKNGKSIKNCYPFKAEPTIEMATLLEKRTSFMKNTLMDNIDEVSILLA